LISIKHDVFAGPDLGDFHLVKCECASLVSADVGGSSHDFTSSKLLYIVIILEHLILGVGE